jgi:hypothetical protein
MRVRAGETQALTLADLDERRERSSTMPDT